MCLQTLRITSLAQLINPLVPRLPKIKIRKLALTDFYWLNFVTEMVNLTLTIESFRYKRVKKVSVSSL